MICVPDLGVLQASRARSMRERHRHGARCWLKLVSSASSSGNLEPRAMYFLRAFSGSHWSWQELRSREVRRSPMRQEPWVGCAL